MIIHIIPQMIVPKSAAAGLEVVLGRALHLQLLLPAVSRSPPSPQVTPLAHLHAQVAATLRPRRPQARRSNLQRHV